MLFSFFLFLFMQWKYNRSGKALPHSLAFASFEANPTWTETLFCQALWYLPALKQTLFGSIEAHVCLPIMLFKAAASSPWKYIIGICDRQRCRWDLFIRLNGTSLGELISQRRTSVEDRRSWKNYKIISLLSTVKETQF